MLDCLLQNFVDPIVAFYWLTIRRVSGMPRGQGPLVAQGMQISNKGRKWGKTRWRLGNLT
jgi:hypothetical protein